MNELKKKDWLIAVIAPIIVLIIGALSLTSGLEDWGDDNAAYISEGVAIAEGRFDEQSELNYYYHPSAMMKEASGAHSLVYVWGYPLFLSLIYRVFGFSFDTIILYKIPSLLSLAVLAGILYLFLKRRFSAGPSLVASLFLCLNAKVFADLNSVYSDLMFLMLSMLSIFLMEMFFDRTQKKRNNIFLGIVYGITMWLTYETRLSGMTVIVVAFLTHAVSFVSQNKERKKKIFSNIYPYIIALILIVVSERLILAPATQNLSDINNNADYIAHIKYYFQLFVLYFEGLFGNGYVILCIFVLGLFVYGFKKDNVIYTLFIAGTIIVNISLPYTQGLRYVYNIFPFVYMYCLYGLKVIASLIVKLWKRFEPKARRSTDGGRLFDFIPRFLPKLIPVAVSFMVILSCVYSVSSVVTNLQNYGRKGERDVYSDEAVEVYRFIDSNISKESVISFYKPRLLYLNTGHKSFRNGVNGHSLTEADYYLRFKLDFFNDLVFDDDLEGSTIVLENSSFILYRLQK